MKKQDIPFEDSLNDDWSHDLNMVEVPVGNRPLWYLGVLIFGIVAIVLLRVTYLSVFRGSYYAARAQGNAGEAQETPAPRGIIYDKEGDALVENKAVFTALLDAHVFITNTALQSTTIDAIQNVLGLSSSTVWAMLNQSESQDFATPVVLIDDLNQTQLVNLQALNLPTITIASDFERDYPKGQIYSSIIGYTGHATQNDLQDNPRLGNDDLVGKSGIEDYYDSTLQGVPGVNIQFKNAQGKVLNQETQTTATIGTPVHLTIDGPLQEYFYNQMANELTALGRQVGVGIALDPRSGAVLSLVNLPGYDNNLFSQPSGNSAAIQNLLTSPLKPLFNRAVSGAYDPGSTIKPLDGVAILKEGIVTADRTIFSPGYLLVPNAYDPSHPTKYLDWRYQGTINLASALAQSSDVYFYVTVGGSPSVTTPPINDASDYGVGGLGISKLFDWWQTFGLGKKTGIDLPNEVTGFLPTPAWKKSKQGTQWLLGDTYNVAIGQGDLTVTPIQLLSYIDAIANGGTIYQPFLNASSTVKVNDDLTYLLPQIQQVQEGMKETVTAKLGTAYTMYNPNESVCAKTGSAQINNNQAENALFVGYAPCDNPQIAVLILIENAKEGSLNAVPIAKQVFDWYYTNRINAK